MDKQLQMLQIIKDKRAQLDDLHKQLDVRLNVDAILKDELGIVHPGKYHFGCSMSKLSNYQYILQRNAAANIVHLDNGKEIALPYAIDRYTGKKLSTSHGNKQGSTK